MTPQRDGVFHQLRDTLARIADIALDRLVDTPVDAFVDTFLTLVSEIGSFNLLLTAHNMIAADKTFAAVAYCDALDKAPTWCGMEDDTCPLTTGCIAVRHFS